MWQIITKLQHRLQAKTATRIPPQKLFGYEDSVKIFSLTVAVCINPTSNPTCYHLHWKQHQRKVRYRSRTARLHEQRQKSKLHFHKLQRHHHHFFSTANNHSNSKHATAFNCCSRTDNKTSSPLNWPPDHRIWSDKPYWDQHFPEGDQLLLHFGKTNSHHRKHRISFACQLHLNRLLL